MTEAPAKNNSASVGKVLRGGLPFSPAVAPLVSRMELVDEYRQTLLRLQGSWDLLALLGQMSGIGAEISQTRSNFQRLTETLLDSLACQLLEQRLHGMRGKAQVAIDILVRNLFERTADVGFLATDARLRAFAQAAGDGAGDEESDERYALLHTELRARFKAYVAKYSVYDDILVLAPDGKVLMRLDESIVLDRSQHPLVAAALEPGVPYVESYGVSDLLGGKLGLLYAAAIHDPSGRPTGVLCLSFRFEDELLGIFARLLGDSAGVDTVLALFDAQGKVVTSSDRWQLPYGVTLPMSADMGASPSHAPPSKTLMRFAGREYLRVGAQSEGYQGYAGPGWHAQALVPVDYAFRADADFTTLADARGDAPSDATKTSGEWQERNLDMRDIFDATLRGIPLQAQQIQLDLARSVWNGKLKGGADNGPEGGAFASAFLQEVSRTGMQIRVVFEEAIAKLQTGAVAAILDEALFHASLAVDIMDRNLYERANDCRWWALTPALRQALVQPDAASRQQANEVLAYINGLYTVYTLLVLFDVEGRVVAVSDPARNDLLGEKLDADTVQATLSLRGPQHYHVGAHAPHALYQDRATYVYTAALQSDQPKAIGAASFANVGGIAIVFDGAPQFEAMLRDSLPRTTSGQPVPRAFGLFLNRCGTVVASTDARFAVGSTVPWATTLLGQPRGAAERQVVVIDGDLYAAGITQSGGYREYMANAEDSEHDVAALVLLYLGRPLAAKPDAATEFVPLPRPAKVAGAVAQEIASFTLGHQWFGLQAAEVEEVLGRVQIVALPKAPPQVEGLMKYRDEMVPVIDLAALLLKDAPTARRDGPLLLCRTAQGSRMALRVAALGSVFEVDKRQLSAWQPSPASPPLHLLSGHSGAREVMLTVLALDSLLNSIADPTQWAEIGRLDELTTASESSPMRTLRMA